METIGIFPMWDRFVPEYRDRHKKKSNRSWALAEKLDCKTIFFNWSSLNDGHPGQGLEQLRTMVLLCRERLPESCAQTAR